MMKTEDKIAYLEAEVDRLIKRCIVQDECIKKMDEEILSLQDDLSAYENEA